MAWSALFFCSGFMTARSLDASFAACAFSLTNVSMFMTNPSYLKQAFRPSGPYYRDG